MCDRASHQEWVRIKTDRRTKNPPVRLYVRGAGRGKAVQMDIDNILYVLYNVLVKLKMVIGELTAAAVGRKSSFVEKMSSALGYCKK